MLLKLIEPSPEAAAFWILVLALCGMGVQRWIQKKFPEERHLDPIWNPATRDE